MVGGRGRAGSGCSGAVQPFLLEMCAGPRVPRVAGVRPDSLRPLVLWSWSWKQLSCLVGTRQRRPQCTPGSPGRQRGVWSWGYWLWS